MNRFARLMTVPLAAAIVLTQSGCPTKPTGYKSEDTERSKTDPWIRVVNQLRKETDIGSCRRILESLRGDLAVNNDPQYQPAAMSPEADKAVRELLSLSDLEVRQLKSAAYSSLDAVYLTECLYMRDVARSLDVVGLPPNRQAEIAFQWVDREVVLNHWATNIDGQVQLMPPAPPSMVLVRGYGSALERCYVFLALLQQIGLDGCLIGPPEAGKRDWTYIAKPSSNTAPTGPFWAVGVRVGADVLVFDPVRGVPFPGPDGKGIATLAQIKANPAQIKTWLDDKTKQMEVTADDVKAATAFLTAPGNSLAPRWQRFEKEMRVDTPPLRLSVDPTALRARFATEAKMADVAFWNVPSDQFSFTRVLSSYTTDKDGGTCPKPEIVQKFNFDLVPWGLFTVPDVLLPQPSKQAGVPGDPGVPEVVERLRLASASMFANSLVAPPSPRERIQRGQFKEVAPYLVQKRREFTAAQSRLRTDHNRDEKIINWAKKAKELYEKQLLATGRQGNNTVAATEAQLALEKFWKEDAPVFETLVDMAVSEAGMAESTYLIALCLHEQAERAQMQLERSMTDPKLKATIGSAKTHAAESWSETKAWWGRYEQYVANQNKTYPGRLEQSQRLSERAARQASELNSR